MLCGVAAAYARMDRMNVLARFRADLDVESDNCFAHSCNGKCPPTAWGRHVSDENGLNAEIAASDARIDGSKDTYTRARDRVIISAHTICLLSL